MVGLLYLICLSGLLVSLLSYILGEGGEWGGESFGIASYHILILVDDWEGGGRWEREEDDGVEGRW